MEHYFKEWEEDKYNLKFFDYSLPIIGAEQIESTPSLSIKWNNDKKFRESLLRQYYRHGQTREKAVRETFPYHVFWKKLPYGFGIDTSFSIVNPFNKKWEDKFVKDSHNMLRTSESKHKAETTKRKRADALVTISKGFRKAYRKARAKGRRVTKSLSHVRKRRTRKRAEQVVRSFQDEVDPAIMDVEFGPAPRGEKRRLEPYGGMNEDDVTAYDVGENPHVEYTGQGVYEPKKKQKTDKTPLRRSTRQSIDRPSVASITANGSLIASWNALLKHLRTNPVQLNKKYIIQSLAQHHAMVVVFRKDNGIDLYENNQNENVLSSPEWMSTVLYWYIKNMWAGNVRHMSKYTYITTAPSQQCYKYASAFPSKVPINFDGYVKGSD